ncbi:hypothetical protein [Streptomyces sp. CC224B]|uniref:hypothetical protein n=1 Tax=Streptomyces sp. CC224B TaxID=3044571 RepID=UPI0024A946C9|nr:hypothetical protein [Streptomyces sp. CC224B]
MAAERSGDSMAMAGATRHLCDAMFHRGDGAAAVDLATAVAGRLEADLVDRGEQGLSVLGMLYPKATMAAAHAETRAAVPDLLEAAEASAERLGADGTRCGPPSGRPTYGFTASPPWCA